MKVKEKIEKVGKIKEEKNFSNERLKNCEKSLYV